MSERKLMLGQALREYPTALDEIEIPGGPLDGVEYGGQQPEEWTPAACPADPKEQTPPYADRCPVCEGLDQPGLTHNTDAPYCSAADPKEQT